MRTDIIKEDVWLAIQYAMLLDYVSNADQADDPHKICFVTLSKHDRCQTNKIKLRKENSDRTAIALERGFTCYKDMPFGTKSFLSTCANVAKKNKNLQPPVNKSFLQIVKEESEKLFKGITQEEFD